MTTRLALSIDQPYASLVMHGVKRFETRSGPFNGDMRPDGVIGVPGPRVNRGDRLWIASTAKKPSEGNMRRTAAESDRLGKAWRALHQAIGEDDNVELARTPMLGFMLGSVTVVDAYPMVELLSGDMPCIEVDDILGHDPILTCWHPASGAPGDETDERDISDQWPFGDWAVGRWAIEFADPEPFADADRVPVKGRQGVWRWDGKRHI